MEPGGRCSGDIFTSNMDPPSPPSCLAQKGTKEESSYIINSLLIAAAWSKAVQLNDQVCGEARRNVTVRVHCFSEWLNAEWQRKKPFRVQGLRWERLACERRRASSQRSDAALQELKVRQTTWKKPKRFCLVETEPPHTCVSTSHANLANASEADRNVIFLKLLVKMYHLFYLLQDKSIVFSWNWTNDPSLGFTCCQKLLPHLSWPGLSD